MDPTDPSYYADLTKFEMAELALMYHAARLEQVSVLIAIFTGYIATAYLIASKLTRFQLVSITFVYSIMVLILTAGYMGISIEASALDEQREGSFQMNIFTSVGAIFLVAWILSLSFMWHSRRR